MYNFFATILLVFALNKPSTLGINFNKSFPSNVSKFLQSKGHAVPIHPYEQIQLNDRIIEWKVPAVLVNVSAFPRGLTPILMPHNVRHKLPPKTSVDYNGTAHQSYSNTTKVIINDHRPKKLFKFCDYGRVFRRQYSHLIAKKTAQYSLIVLNKEKTSCIGVELHDGKMIGECRKGFFISLLTPKNIGKKLKHDASKNAYFDFVCNTAAA